MKKRTASFALLSSLLTLVGLTAPAFANSAPSPSGSMPNLLPYVDPFVGTTNGGDTYPGASAPFGMVQWSPDETVSVGNAPSGYDYNATTLLRGFSLNHVSGAGCGVYGNFPFIPFNGNVTTSPVANPNLYTLPFSHSQESASPGEYQVTTNGGIQVSLTATTRSGRGEFQFPSGATPSLLLDAGSSLNNNGNAQDGVSIVGNNEIEGYAQANQGEFCGGGSGYKVYFAAVFSTPFSSYGTWNGSTLTSSSTSSTGSATGAYVTFPSNTKIDVQVGLSYVSEANALLNLQTEQPSGSTFSSVLAATQQAWNEDLNTIDVTSSSSKDLTNFYTALYHVFLSPTTFSDVNGQYMGFDDAVHTLPSGHVQYTDFSGWDIYRSELPLLAFLKPSIASDMVQSLVNDGSQGGAIPKWPVANDETAVMVGDSADPMIASAYAMGAHQFDTATALSLMEKIASTPTTIQGTGISGSINVTERPGLAFYLQDGYVPENVGGNMPTSGTLEYAIDDASIGNFAKAIGQPSSFYQPYLQRGANWKNVINPSTGLAQPRYANGAWMFTNNPASSQNYTEGDGYQYRFLVPQDYPGLSRWLGGRKATINDLDQFFTQLNAGSSGQYAWMGNEPSILIPYLYDFVGDAPDAQNILREAENTLWTPTPAGIPGNDDLGTMSAWYVWSTLGLYPTDPGVAGFALGSPLFTTASVTYDDGKHVLVIDANQASDSNPYVKKLTINGVAQTGSWFSLASLEAQQTTIFQAQMANSPVNTQVMGSFPAENLSTVNLDVASANPSSPSAQAGANAKFSIVLSLHDAGAMYPYRASITSSTLSLPSTTMNVMPGSTPVSIAIPSGTPAGIYPLTISFTPTSSIQANLSPLLVNVIVTNPSNTFSLWGAYNNVGLTSSSTLSQGNLDGGGRSYAQSVLAAAGFVPGYTFTADGASFVWPSFADGYPDDVQANQGQTVNVSGQGHALVLIGSSINGNTVLDGSSPSTGVTITYTDGTSVTDPITMNDWTLGGGSTPLDPSNTIVGTFDGRNTSSGFDSSTKTYLFAVSLPIDATKTIQSVTFPSQGNLYVFLMNVAP